MVSPSLVGEKVKLYQASCVALAAFSKPNGVLLRGKSGSGKSDLALRLIDRGARLVADDCVYLTRKGDCLTAAAPPAISGKLEVFGLGIIDLPRLSFTKLRLVVDLATEENLERMPEHKTVRLCGVELPLFRLAPAEPSAPIKVERALARLAP